MMLSAQTKRELSFLEKDYVENIIPALTKKFSKTNPHSVPRIDKIVLSVGFGRDVSDKRAVEAAVNELSLISGRKPATSRSRKAIAAFKLREGQVIGAYVTLRGRECFYFLEKLIYVAIPSINNSQGFPVSSFDRNFNFAFGLKERLLFPEMTYDTIYKTGGVHVTMHIKGANKRDEAIALLQALKFPVKSTLV